MSGRSTQLSAAVVEVTQRYLSQFQLLEEIQLLRSRWVDSLSARLPVWPGSDFLFPSFAIDWRPAQRLLLYLKSAALVCHLEVEEGYPSTGRARLVSVQRDGRAVDTSGLQVPCDPHHSPVPDSLLDLGNPRSCDLF